MRKLITIALNELRLELSDLASWVFLLALPLLFTFILGQALQGSNMSDPRLTLQVVGAEGGPLTERLLAQLEASEVLRPEPVEAPASDTPALFLPQGFEADLAAGRPIAPRLQLPGEARQALAVRTAVQAALFQTAAAAQAAQTAVEQAAALRPFASQQEREAYYQERLARALALQAVPAVQIEAQSVSLQAAQEAEGFDQASPGQLVSWTLITLLGASQMLVDERLNGTLRRMLTTPTGRGLILGGKLLGRLALGLLQMLLLVGGGALLFGVAWGRSPLALTLILVSFALAAVALGTLLATIARTRGQASGMTILFSMLMAALGGAWWPLEVTPAAYQAAVRVLPTTWAMQGFNAVILRGAGPAEVLPQVGVLLLFALGFFALSLGRLKME